MFSPAEVQYITTEGNRNKTNLKILLILHGSSLSCSYILDPRIKWVIGVDNSPGI
jgi:hypothetical protein